MAIFGKTPKGLEEVKNKAHGLSAIERRVLIFIDGKRVFDDLKALPRVTDLDGIISFLAAEGYIALVTPSAASPPESREQLGEVPSPFRELPAIFEPDKFDMAKNYMTNTLNHFKGFYGATRLVRDIDACETYEALRGFYDEWCEGIDSTRAGKKRGEKLRKDLLDVL